MISNLIELDQTIFNWFNLLSGQNAILDVIYKIIAVGFVYLIPIILLALWFFGYKKIAISSALAGLLAWFGFSNLIGAIWFRARPFLQENTRELIFHRPDKSFPSDHAAFLTALTVYFYLAGYRKLGHFFLVLTILISITRVITGVHFPGDVIAGWIVGAAAALIIWTLRNYIEKYIANPVINFAKRSKL